jgi:hypothetical protein
MAARRRRSAPRVPGRARASHFRIRVTLPLSLPEAFTWCTDYREDDARLTHSRFRRRILEKDARRVVYEDLEDAPGGGWSWNRYRVDLFPPDRWRLALAGSHQDIRGDYRLEARGPRRTELAMRFTVRARAWDGAAALAETRAGVRDFWARLVGAIERESGSARARSR